MTVVSVSLIPIPCLQFPVLQLLDNVAAVLLQVHGLSSELTCLLPVYIYRGLGFN